MRPVLIGGMGRSGTSILKNTLAQHSTAMNFGGEIRWLADMDGLFHFSSQVSHSYTPAILDAAWKRFVIRLTHKDSTFLGLFGEDYGQEMLEKLSHALFDTHKGSKYHLMPEPQFPFHEAFAGQAKNGVIHWALAQWVDELMAHRTVRMKYPSERSFWIDDTPENVWWFDEAQKVWPAAVCIHATRHPYDIVASIKARHTAQRNCWWWPVKPEDIAKRLHNLWYIAASHKEFFYRVPMEEFVAEPERVLSPILWGLGLEWEEGMDRFIQPNITHEGRWKKELTKKEVKNIRPILEPVLRGWGYAKD